MSIVANLMYAGKVANFRILLCASRNERQISARLSLVTCRVSTKGNAEKNPVNSWARVRMLRVSADWRRPNSKNRVGGYNGIILKRDGEYTHKVAVESASFARWAA